jgi:hypothetical protein
MFSITFPVGYAFERLIEPKKSLGLETSVCFLPAMTRGSSSDEPVVVIDISGMKEYAKLTRKKAIKKARRQKRKDAADLIHLRNAQTLARYRRKTAPGLHFF